MGRGRASEAEGSAADEDDDAQADQNDREQHVFPAFEDLGDGWTRLHSQSLVDSFEAREGMLASGMETGIQQGYAKLDGLLADGAVR